MLNSDKKFIAEKIKLARIKAGLTQEQFAEKVNLSSKQVSRIECGNFLPLLPTFFRIAEVLNLTLDDFGINASENENKSLNRLLEIIHDLSESELDSYYNVLQCIKKNFKPIKNKKTKTILNSF